MNYIEITIPVTSEENAEIMIAMLSDFPFDSFTNEDTEVKAYIQSNDFENNKAAISECISEMDCTFTSEQIEQQNWNELWESNFEPIDVDGRCLIRAPFHQRDSHYNEEVIIMPKMSFGTGHHATTYLMVAEIMDMNFSGLCGLDMGSGTGVLAILAVKRGASHMDAIDIDEWACENAVENIATNGVEGKVTPILGDASLLSGRKYDFILANINRNILINDMDKYVATLKKGGTLTLSGIFETDMEAIIEKATSIGLIKSSERTRNGWATIKFNLK